MFFFSILALIGLGVWIAGILADDPAWKTCGLVILIPASILTVTIVIIQPVS